LIEGETARGARGHIVFKMNQLTDDEIIAALYRASCAGVRVRLIVRGACGLRPGLPGVSEHIRLTSLVGRFLEHSRIFYFANGGAEAIYIGSADLMPRNLDKRVETLVPIEDPLVRQRLLRILAIYARDTVNARVLQPDGAYGRVAASGAPSFDAQAYFLAHDV
jgi:polyphosphate kinase